MRLALAQINATVGDLSGNARLIEGFTARAQEAGADLVVFPELALCGYPPRDLLLQEGFVEAAEAEADRVGSAASAGITLVFGCPLRGGASGVSNSLVAYRDGRRIACYDKRLLPTYDVFDEDRYFTAGDRPVIIDVAGTRVGLSVCEDLWRGADVGFSDRYLADRDPVAELIDPPGGGPGAALIVNPSASPFVLGKGQRHREILRRHAMRHRVHVAAVNQVGGNDELIFDGSAAIYDAAGSLVASGKPFEEDLLVIDLPREESAAGVAAIPDPLLQAQQEELLFRALVLGARDYCRKTGFTSAVLGLSGGIDSAVVCVLAAAALGPANVLGVSMPSRYSSEGSKDDARELASRLGVRFTTLPIENAFSALLRTLQPEFAGRDADVTEENLQSRARGTLLMALSNKFGHLLLSTGNKSELAVGYATLYGDMNGGLAVLSDVTKGWVYRLARWINANASSLGIPGLSGPPIPEASITKPPSAELRPGQTDQDTLPPYDVLDEVLRRYVEGRQSPGRIARETGFDPVVVARLVRMIDLSEYKRRQAALGLKVSGVAFGSGRRMPIAQRYRPERAPG